MRWRIVVGLYNSGCSIFFFEVSVGKRKDRKLTQVKRFVGGKWAVMLLCYRSPFFLSFFTNIGIVCVRYFCCAGVVCFIVFLSMRDERLVF